MSYHRIVSLSLHFLSVQLQIERLFACNPLSDHLCTCNLSLWLILCCISHFAQAVVALLVAIVWCCCCCWFIIAGIASANTFTSPHILHPFGLHSRAYLCVRFLVEPPPLPLPLPRQLQLPLPSCPVALIPILILEGEAWACCPCCYCNVFDK